MTTAGLLRQEPHKQIQDLRTLYRSALRLAKTDDLVEALFQIVADDLVTSISMKRVLALYYNKDKGILECKAHRGFNGHPASSPLPFEAVNGLMKRVYSKRESLNVVHFDPTDSSGLSMPTECQILEQDCTGLEKQKRQAINVCLVGKKATATDFPHWRGLKEGSIFSLKEEDQTVKDLLGGPCSFLILPLVGDGNFLGYVLTDKNSCATPVSYGEARLASALVSHASELIAKAVKQKEMVDKIEEQNRELKIAHDQLAGSLKQSEHLKSFYESIIQNLKSGLITVDQKMEISHINRSAEEILGYPKGDLLGKSIRTILSDSEMVEDCVLKEQVESLEMDCGLLTEIKMQCKDGCQLPMEACFSVIVDSVQDIKGLSCIFRDITEKKLMEQHLARIERLASLGELTAGVAHEIKNPLAGINGALQILSQSFSTESPEWEVFKEIFRQIKRLDQSVQHLLKFAIPVKPNFCSVKLINVINRTMPLVANRIKAERIETRVNLDSDHPSIQGDPYLLQQALLNILLNALDAMNPGGLLEIHTCWADKAAGCSRIKCISSLNRTFTQGVRVIIRDSGCGIAAKDLDSIFNPFFTSKTHGTGLGLSITHRIIEQHHGSIFVESDLDAGTIFIINLPCHQTEMDSLT
jgi:PAS domain S-box-containing protein